MKKFLCSVLMIICMFGLTACSGEEKVLSYDEGAISSQVKDMYAQISACSDSEFADMTELNMYGLEDLSDSYYSNYSIHVGGTTVVNAIDSYRKSLDELGTVTATDNMTFDAKKDELIVTYELTGTKHNGSIEFIFDDNFTLTSATTNVAYSFKECMVKAGVNTLIGMGTVFLMLIVIMIIIIILGAATKGVREEKPKASVQAASVDKAIEAIVAREEQTDDLELIAVIAAAIAAAEGASNTDGFVVRSIRRIR